MSESSKSGLMDSTLDAVKISNILLRVALFIIFGIITIFPYFVKNMDELPNKIAESGATGGAAVLMFIKGMFAMMWKGVWLGLSTCFEAALHFKEVLDAHHYATIFYCLVVMVGAVGLFFQPMRLFFNILDMKKGRAHSKVTIFFFTLALIVVVLSPLAWVITGGDTITDMISEDGVGDGDVGGYDNQTNESMAGNQSDLYYVTMTI